MRQYFGMSPSDSALSQRLGPELFKLIMEETLRPLADAALHPGCFLGALRLVGIDGTTWSVCNTPQHLARIVKARTRRGCSAFAKIAMSALVAQERLAVAAAEVEAAGVLRISLRICLEYFQLFTACQHRIGHQSPRVRNHETAGRYIHRQHQGGR